MRIQRKDIPFLKALIMFAMGAPLASLGVLSGIGVQVAAQPMIRFLLGLTPERSLGTAVVFGLVTAAAGIIGASLGGLKADLTASAILAVTATLGALLVVRTALDPKLTKVRRLAQSAAMLLGLYVIVGSARSHFGPEALNIAFFRTSAGLGLIGLAAGLLSTIFHLASGVLLVGGLVLLTGMASFQAILISLVVIMLASLLPAITHGTGGRVDTGAGASMILGGAIGGLAAGFALSKLAAASSSIPLITFSLCAMFLSAWTAWKMQS